MDFEAMTTEELEAAISGARAEIERRSKVHAALARVNHIMLDMLRDLGASDGGPWVESALGYPEGYRVQHNGRLWESQIRANVWEPGDPDDPQSYRWWKDITPAPEPDPGTTPAWAGEGHAYEVGDVVTYQGTEYECTQAHTSQPDWTPDATPSLWTTTGAS